MYGFLLVINSNLALSRTVTEIQRLIGQSRQFFPPPSHVAPSFGVTLRIYGKSFMVSETRVFQAADGKDLVILACTVFD